MGVFPVILKICTPLPRKSAILCQPLIEFGRFSAISEHLYPCFSQNRGTNILKQLKNAHFCLCDQKTSWFSPSEGYNLSGTVQKTPCGFTSCTFGLGSQGPTETIKLPYRCRGSQIANREPRTANLKLQISKSSSAL